MDRRTALISSASVVGVVLAGATAVGANIGILGQADNSGIGELSAVIEASPTLEPEIIDVYLESPSPSPTAVVDVSGSADRSVDSANTQSFLVEDAGSVAVELVDGNLVIGEVITNDGWTATVSRSATGSVSITFGSADTTYVFTAEVAADGSISAGVEEPIVEVVITEPPATSTPPTPDAYADDDDDDYDDDDDDHDDDDDYDDDHDDDEHEGRDDDD